MAEADLWTLAGCVWEGAFASKPAPTGDLCGLYNVCLALHLPVERACSRILQAPRSINPAHTPEHQPNNRLRRRLIIGLIQLGLAGHCRDLPVEIGIGLGGCPDAEHQVVGVNRCDQATVNPALDAVDIVLGLGIELFNLIGAQVGAPCMISLANTLEANGRSRRCGSLSGCSCSTLPWARRRG